MHEPDSLVAAGIGRAEQRTPPLCRGRIIAYTAELRLAHDACDLHGHVRGQDELQGIEGTHRRVQPLRQCQLLQPLDRRLRHGNATILRDQAQQFHPFLSRHAVQQLHDHVGDLGTGLAHLGHIFEQNVAITPAFLHRLAQALVRNLVILVEIAH